MKELSIEEKAKAYDEVREKIAIRFGSNVADEIFSQFEMSEDERIREELIDFVKSRLAGFPQCEKYIAWLEKQGEQTSDKIVEKARTEKQRVLLTETDGSANIDWDCRSLDDVKLLLEYGLDYIKKLEKQGEQKPADKVEPKFHEGDWLVFNNKHQSIYQVEKIEDGYYILRHTHGGTFRVCVLHDESLRLWTIQDAKDGDVLACEDFRYTSLMLFKSFSNGRISLHCWHNSQTNNFHINTDVALRKDANIYPATKEQRELLFQKMKEAGYEWDGEKIELKKIEQLTTFEEAVKDLMNDYRDAIGDNDATIEEIKKHSEYLLSLIPQKAAEWSEEDEYYYGIIQYILNNESVGKTDKENAINWFKSFKDKVQPKQEWSGEDKKKLDKIYLILGQAADTHAFSTTCRLIGDKECIELQDFLKSLRPQNRTYYWTENEIKFAISDYIRGAESYEKMVEKLRCLKPQNTWKSSEEQILAINTAVGTLTGKQLIEIQEQLKKLSEE